MIKLLFVDDEENILHGYKRNLRGKFEILTASSARNGLDVLNENLDIAIIVSDYNMPGMKGIEFLAETAKVQPNCIRILLTGFADLSIAIKAVNQGNLFRFLTKPCPHNELLLTLEQAVKQHQLIIAEKQLLDETLKGTIKVLVDILAAVNPFAFNRANLFKNFAQNIFSRISEGDFWKEEMACLLSQIGCVSIPHEILEKKDRGEKLNEDEAKLFYSHPQFGNTLLEKIPRLEEISQSISDQFFDEENHDKSSDKKPLTTQLLQILNLYYESLEEGESVENSLKKVLKYRYRFDEKLISAFEAEVKGVDKGLTILTLSLKELVEKMVLAANLYDENDFLLLPKGTMLSAITIKKIKNYSKMRAIKEPIKILG